MKKHIYVFVCIVFSFIMYIPVNASHIESYSYDFLKEEEKVDDFYTLKDYISPYLHIFNSQVGEYEVKTYPFTVNMAIRLNSDTSYFYDHPNRLFPYVPALGLDFENNDYTYVKFSNIEHSSFFGDYEPLPAGYKFSTTTDSLSIIYNGETYSPGDNIKLVDGEYGFSFVLKGEYKIIKNITAKENLTYHMRYDGLSFDIAMTNNKVVEPEADPEPEPEQPEVDDESSSFHSSAALPVPPSGDISGVNMPPAPIDYGNYYAYRDNDEVYNNYLKDGREDLIDFTCDKYTVKKGVFSPNANYGKHTITPVVCDYLQVGKTYKVTVEDFYYSGFLHSFDTNYEPLVPDYSSLTLIVEYGHVPYLYNVNSGSFIITVTDPEHYFEFITEGSVMYPGSSDINGSYMVFDGVNYKLYIQEIKSYSDALTTDMDNKLDDINKGISDINDRQETNDNILNDFGDLAQNEIGGRLDEYEEMEDYILGNTMGTIQDVDFEGATFDSLPAGFLSAFMWVGSTLQNMFDLTEFSVVFPVMVIIVLAVILIGLRRLWQ